MERHILFLLLLSSHLVLSQIFLNDIPETGYIDVGRGELFYWFFQARNDPKNAPLMMWLSGGPGTSSALGLFFINGPFKVKEDLSLEVNPYSWNNKSNIIYVDQPVGTGFSTANKYVVNEEQIAEDMYLFLLKFYAMHPDLSNKSFYIVGESYAGHYIPAIAAYLIKKKNNYINLKGIAIGNGLISPSNQIGVYGKFAYENGLINPLIYAITHFGFNLCKHLIRMNLLPLALIAGGVSMMLVTGPPFYDFFNPYDYTQSCLVPPECYNMSLMKGFLARPDVIKEIKANKKEFNLASATVYLFLLIDWFYDLSEDIAFILHNDIPVLIYNGELDYMCNWKGLRVWIDNFEWEYKFGFSKSKVKDWLIRGEIAAKYRSYKGLTEIKVLKSGHMVPRDKPEFAFDMINRFISSGINETNQTIKIN